MCFLGDELCLCVIWRQLRSLKNSVFANITSDIYNLTGLTFLLALTVTLQTYSGRCLAVVVVVGRGKWFYLAVRAGAADFSDGVVWLPNYIYLTLRSDVLAFRIWTNLFACQRQLFFIIFKILDAVHIDSHNIIKYKLVYAIYLLCSYIFSHFHTFFDSSNRKINPPSYLIYIFISFLCVVLLGTRLCWSQILFKKYINVFI